MTSAVIHQTLHGYDQGHRLLATSFALDEEVSEILLVMSDLAGPRQANGFDEYLTGFPLPSLGLYAFARTWLAPEMPRPGCVWTHTLLVSSRDLPSLDGRQLTQHHKRPDFPPDRPRYAKPVAMGQIQLLTNPTHGARAEPILQALYEFPDQPVWSAASSSAEYESLVLAVWNQQWPDLRKRFSFSTGSLSPRRLAGKLIDLQIVPESQIPTWFELKNVKEAHLRKGAAKWVRRAAQDLDAVSDFHGFLQSVGTGGREMFAPLARLFVGSEVAVGAAETGRLLIEADSLRMPKASKLGLQAHLFRPGSLLNDEAILDFLLENPDWDAAARSAGISERAEGLVAVRPDAAWRLARKAVEGSSDSAARNWLLGALARSTTSDQVLERDDGDWPLILELLRVRPVLAAAPDLWRTSRQTQRELLAAVDRSKATSADKQEILRAIALSGNGDAIRGAASLWPAPTAIACLEAANRSKDQIHISLFAEDLLARQVPAVRNWISSHPGPSDAVLLLVARAMDPGDVFGRVGTDRWVRLAQWGPALNDPRALAFMFRLGLRGGDEAAMHLVLATLQPVHRLAARKAMPDSAWHVLEPVLPRLGMVRDWDRCERIRRAAATSWLEQGWPTELLWPALGTQDLRRRLMKSFEVVRDGQR